PAAAILFPAAILSPAGILSSTGILLPVLTGARGRRPAALALVEHATVRPRTVRSLRSIKDVCVLADEDADLHAEVIACIPEPCARERDGLRRIPRIGHRDQVVAGADGVGRI